MIPDRVAAVTALARSRGFADSSSDAVGVLLRDLVADSLPGDVAEIGTGYGHGTAWILEGLRDDQRLTTIDLDPDRVEQVGSLFSGEPRLTVLHGDWRELLPLGPFAVLFADGGKAVYTHPHLLLASLIVGGSLVIDGVFPEDHWPNDLEASPDPVRRFWLSHTDCVATETILDDGEAVIVAVRVK